MGIEDDLSEITAILQPVSGRMHQLLDRYSYAERSTATPLALFFRTIAETVDGKTLRSLKLQSRVHVPHRFFEGPAYSNKGLIVFEWISGSITTRHGIYLAEISKESRSSSQIDKLARCRETAKVLLRYTPSVFFIDFSNNSLRIYPALVFSQATSYELDDYPSLGFSVFLRFFFSGFVGDQLLDGTREFRALQMMDEQRAEMVLFVTATDDSHEQEDDQD